MGPQTSMRRRWRAARRALPPPTTPCSCTPTRGLARPPHPGHRPWSQGPGLQVKYVTVERFTDDFINAVTDKGRIEGFKQSYRDNDGAYRRRAVLAEKQQTQVEFFHTFSRSTRPTSRSSSRPTGRRASLKRSKRPTLALRPGRRGGHRPSRPRDAHRDCASRSNGGLQAPTLRCSSTWPAA